MLYFHKASIVTQVSVKTSEVSIPNILLPVAPLYPISTWIASIVTFDINLVQILEFTSYSLRLACK